jgi:sugar phosphate isomerase/epimerase
MKNNSSPASALLSRRLFMGGATALLLPAMQAQATHSKDKGAPYGARLGFQAYSVRDLLARDPGATLAKVAAMGYREIELFSPAQVIDYAPINKKLGLEVVSLHMPGFFGQKDAWARWLAEGKPVDPAGYGLAALVRACREHGLRYIGYPHGAPDEAMRTPEAYLQFVALMDGVGAFCKRAGITFFYHNHHHEFAASAEGTFLDVLLRHTNPEHVCLELDVCWAAQAGQDPVAVLTKYASRVKLLHLKDRKPGLPTSTGPGWPEGNIFAPVGSGSLDMPAILRAAHAAHVQHVFVEQDASDGDVVDDLGSSFRYVKTTGL